MIECLWIKARESLINRAFAPHRKEVIMNAQGASSLGHPKKNIAIDICNNNGWDDDDTFKLQIGNWVPQDSFHLKGYWSRQHTLFIMLKI